MADERNYDAVAGVIPDSDPLGIGIYRSRPSQSSCPVGSLTFAGLFDGVDLKRSSVHHSTGKSWGE